MAQYRYLILGGGVVAGYAAQAFVEAGIEPGELAIVSADNTLPYERPPLSKDYLAGEKKQEDILINEPGFYKAHGIDTYLNTPIEDVNFDAKKLISGSHEPFTFDKLLIATGSRLRKLDLPGAGDEAIFYLRWLDDANRIRRRAEQAQHAIVVGGGFIGMETAAVLAGYDIDVTWIFPDRQPLAGFFTARMADFFMHKYKSNGVTLLPHTKVQAFRREAGRLVVVPDSGMALPADMVIAGVGVEPATDLFVESSLQLDQGIVVNEYLETNLPGFYAAGDVANYRDILFDKQRHIEHWDNAKVQGEHVAKVMTGRREVFDHIPYFFSDEFDLSWEFWGDTDGADDVVHRGDVEGGSFSVWWLKAEHLIAAFMMDRPKEESEQAQAWIRNKQPLSAQVLAREGLHLKT